MQDRSKVFPILFIKETTIFSQATESMQSFVYKIK